MTPFAFTLCIHDLLLEEVHGIFTGTGERHDSKVPVLVNKVNVQVKEMATDKVGALTITRTN